MDFNNVNQGNNGMQPNPMPNGNVVQPNPAPTGNVVQPNPAPAGNVVQPNPAPAGNVVQPNPMPSGNGVQPSNKKNNSKIIIIVGAVIVVAIAVVLILLLGGGNSNNTNNNGNNSNSNNTNNNGNNNANNNSSSSNNQNEENVGTLTEEELKRKIEITPVLTERGDKIFLIKNNNNGNVTVIGTAYYYDSNGKEISNRSLTENSIAPNETVVFESFLYSVDNATDVKIVVTRITDVRESRLINCNDKIEILSDKMYKSKSGDPIVDAEIKAKGDISEYNSLSVTVLFYKNGKVYDTTRPLIELEKKGDTYNIKTSPLFKADCDDYKIYLHCTDWVK